MLMAQATDVFIIIKAKETKESTVVFNVLTYTLQSYCQVGMHLTNNAHAQVHCLLYIFSDKFIHQFTLSSAPLVVSIL
jgi:hypothetical protein